MSEEDGHTLVGMIGGFFLGLLVAAVYWQDKAIEHGAAQHNPTTGDFEWKVKEGEQ